MSEITPAHIRQQQRVDELCAASIRALTGAADLHFRARRLHQGRRMLPPFAPHLHPAHDGVGSDLDSFRGAADGLALRLLYSDAQLHARLMPDDPIERLVFDLLEQFRVEAHAPVWMPGLARNLRRRFEQWSVAYHHSGLNESARGILLYATAQTCRSRVSGEPPIELTEELIDTTRGMIVRRISADLVGLRRQRHDQNAYAAHALRIARVVAELMHSRDDERGEDRDETDEDNGRHTAFNLLFDLEDNDESGFAVADAGERAPLDAGAAHPYKVFTRAYDREVDAATLVRGAVLVEYREQLDRRIATLGINLPRLARELKSLLAEPAVDGWDSAQEEGLIDGRRLAQLISAPAERRLFRADRAQPVADCLVSFLIDCSGSMRQHIMQVAVLTDLLARALEMAGVSSEILGFTTGGWSGGRALRDWQRAGQPAHPGRLNELCHMVFKSADTPWRRARPSIGALLKGDLFREGIDGEAVEWACTRMAGRGEARRLLLVISDGSPMDSATHRLNGQHYLDRHLRDVVQRRQAASDIAICGIGVGLDLSPYYRHSHALDLSAPLNYQVFGEILWMIRASSRACWSFR